MSARRPSPDRSAAGNRDRDRDRSGDGARGSLDRGSKRAGDEEGKRRQDALVDCSTTQFPGVHPSRLAALASRAGFDKQDDAQHEEQKSQRRQHGDDSRSSNPTPKRRRKEKDDEKATTHTCDEFGRRIPARSERRQGGDRGEKKKKREGTDSTRSRRARDGHRKRDEPQHTPAARHDAKQHDLEEGEIPQHGAVHDALEEGELPPRMPTHRDTIPHLAEQADPSQPAHEQPRPDATAQPPAPPLTAHHAPKQPGPALQIQHAVEQPNPTPELSMQATTQHDALADPAHHTPHADSSPYVPSASVVVEPVESNAILAPLTRDTIHTESQPQYPSHDTHPLNDDSTPTAPQPPADLAAAAQPLRPVVSFKLRVGRRVGRAISLGDDDAEEGREVAADTVGEETVSGEKDSGDGALGSESGSDDKGVVDSNLEEASGEPCVVDGLRGDERGCMAVDKTPDEQPGAAKEEDVGTEQLGEERKSRKRREREPERHGKRSHKHKHRRERRGKREENRHGKGEKRARRDRHKDEKGRGGTSRDRDRDKKSRGSTSRDADRDAKSKERRKTHSDKDESWRDASDKSRAAHTEHNGADKEEHPAGDAAVTATTEERRSHRGRLFQGLFRLQPAGRTANTTETEPCARAGDGAEGVENEKKISAGSDTRDKEEASCHQGTADIHTHIVDSEEMAAIEPDVERRINNTSADASAGPEGEVEQATVLEEGEEECAEQNAMPASAEPVGCVEDTELADEGRYSNTPANIHAEQHGQAVMHTIPDTAQPAADVVKPGEPASATRFGADWCVSPAQYVSSVESGHECACEEVESEAGDMVLQTAAALAERRRVREAAESGHTEQDMFGEEFDAEEMQDEETIASSSMCASTADSCDDKDGFHVFRAGELIAGRYLVYSLAGKGVFSTVVRARDMQHDALSARPREVVVKVIRRNEMMYKSSMHEEKVLRQLAETDTNNRGHCVRLYEAFDYLGHRCLVFDSYALSLRKMVTTFKGTGVSLVAVRAYGRQMLLALRLLKKCELVHADIKLDNMLTMDGRPVLVMSDFGSAVHVRGDGEIAPYLVSRFYRAPEVILGIPFGYYTDMWAVACCLFELYTGTYLFPGRSNNEMLKLHMDALGSFPRKTLRTGQFISTYFDSEFRFIYQERNENLNRELEKRIAYSQEATRPVRDRIMAAAQGTSDAGAVALEHFADLLLKMLALDPHKRIMVKGALTHPFILPV